MRAIGFLVLLLLAAPLRAGDGPDWLSRVNAPPPGNFPPLGQTELSYRFGWGGFLAGRLDAVFGSGRQGDLTLSAKGGTAGTVRALWLLDATHEARADRKTLLPSETEQHEIYRSMRIDTVAQFSEKEVSFLRSKEPAKGEIFKRRILKLPRVLDLHSAYRYLRSQPLETGDRFVFVAFAGESGFLATVTVEKREKLKLRGASRPAIRCDLRLEKVDKKRRLVPFKKCKRVTGWLSDDADRIPLRVEGEIFVGKVWAELDGAPPSR